MLSIIIVKLFHKRPPNEDTLIKKDTMQLQREVYKTTPEMRTHSLMNNVWLHVVSLMKRFTVHVYAQRLELQEKGVVYSTCQNAEQSHK